MEDKWIKLKCSVCHEVNAQYYEDCEGIFDKNLDNPLCAKHHERLFESLERKCGMCGSKIRGCSC
jgi:hypothetical protein